jgi:predicted amidohydrolase
VLVHPSNLVLRFCQDSMITRCLENRVFAVTCNRVGSESRGGLNLTFTGNSQITGLNGTVLAHGSVKGEETVVAELRPQEADNKFATEYNNLMQQRRPDLYVTR